MFKTSKYFLGICYTASSLYGAINTGGNSDTLDAAVKTVNAGPDFTLNFNQNVTLISVAQANNPTQVRALNSDGTFTYGGQTLTVQGNGQTLNGSVRGFFIGGRNSTNTGSVTINNLHFSGTSALGGSGGGGGLGAGGGVFIGRNCVAVLDSCSFTSCSAVGGNGNILAGGGGMKGNGSGSAGSGGFGGDGAIGGGGASDFNLGNASGNTPGNNFDGGGAPSSSGVGGSGTTGGAGGFGGGGAGGAPGGAGGFGGGGGGSGTTGGAGGFGGGGGATAGGIAGVGGFGGGGGHDSTGTGGTGGFGGGNGLALAGQGGAGAGFGGALFIQDGADVTILNTITFSGNTVAAGLGNANTDPLANFGAAGKDIFMMSSSQLTFNISSDVVLTNPIAGDQGAGGGNTTTGGLIKQGSALLSLSGANTYTGPTTVQTGELRITGVNASVVSDITVQAGATLSGDFTANRNNPNTGGGSITNHGTVSPGVGGVGTINLHQYIQSATGTLLVDITPTGNVNDQIFLDMLPASTASLDGTLNVVVGAGNYIEGTQYLVINSTTTGTFATVVKSGPNANNVDINVAYGSVILTIVNNRLFQDQIINPGNPTQVVNAITGEPITPGSDFAQVTEVLGTLSNSAVNKALIAMSPVMLGTLEWINARNNSYVASLLDQHTFQLSCSARDCQNKNNSFWAATYGNAMNNYKTFDNLTPYTANGVGGVMGYDYCWPHFTLGVAGGYTRTDLNWKEDLGGGNLNSYYGAAYGSYNREHFTVDASVLAGGNGNHLKRNIEFGIIDRRAKSDFWSYFVTGHLGVESDWTWGKGTFVPFALADYHHYDRNHFKESGANSINLKVRSNTQNMMRGEAGVKAYYTVSHPNSCYAPYVALSWVGEFPLESSYQNAYFVGRAPRMKIKSYNSSQQLISPQLGFKATSNKGFSFTLGYKGLFNRKTSINEGEGRLEWVF